MQNQVNAINTNDLAHGMELIEATLLANIAGAGPRLAAAHSCTGSCADTLLAAASYSCK